MELGATFSHPHLTWLGIDPKKALTEFKTLGLTWIRLGCYWNEIEKNEGKYDFSDLDPLINFCEKNKIKVALSVGMKAPRWPEYYFPDWLLEKIQFKKLQKITQDNKIVFEPTLRFIENCVKHYSKYRTIKCWQVENEPLDPSGEKWLRIDKYFLNTEISLVEELDQEREIVINLWGNELSKRKIYKKVLQTHSDTIGFDIYLKHPLTILTKFIKYIGPQDTDGKLIKITDEINTSGKKFWITELQSEPWEPNELLAKAENPPSFSPADFEKNFQFGLKLNAEVILFWGFEYWLWKKLNGDSRYWNEAKRVILKYS